MLSTDRKFVCERNILLSDFAGKLFAGNARMLSLAMEGWGVAVVVVHLAGGW